MRSINAVSTYTVIGLVFIAAIILLFILTHLILVIIGKHKSKDKSKNKQLLYFLYTTTIGLLSYEICIISVIIILLQGVNMFQLNEYTFFHASHYTIETMIPIYDSIGHILILIVLIGRFKFSFQNTIFGEFKYLMRFMYSYIILLTLLLITSIFLLIFKQDSLIVTIIEITSELSIEIVILCIGYLFINKLYIVLKWSLKAENPLKTDLSLYRNFKLSLGPNLSQRRSHEQNTNDKVPKMNRMQLSFDNPKQKTGNAINGPNESDANLINIMTKMALLIILCVIISTLSIMFNTYLAIKHINWACRNEIYYLFLIMDIITTSLMIYLQYNFSENIYLKLCGKLDAIFLKIGLQCVKFLLTKKNIKHNTQLNVQNIKSIKPAKSMRKLETINECVESNENEISNKPETPATPFIEKNVEKFMVNNLFNHVQKKTDGNIENKIDWNLNEMVEVEIVYDDTEENKNDNSKSRRKSKSNSNPGIILSTPTIISSPKTPLMCVENMNGNSVYKVPAIIMSKHSNQATL